MKKRLDENQLQGICRTCGRKYRCKDALRYLDLQGCSQYEVLTNEEWLNNLNTEEKAKFLHDIQFSCNTCTLTSFRHYKSNIMQCPLNVACAKENGVVEWLKQPHTTKE